MTYNTSWALVNDANEFERLLTGPNTENLPEVGDRVQFDGPEGDLFQVVARLYIYQRKHTEFRMLLKRRPIEGA